MMPQAIGNTKLQLPHAPPWQVPVPKSPPLPHVLSARMESCRRTSPRIGVPCIAAKGCSVPVQASSWCSMQHFVSPTQCETAIERLSRKPGSVGKVLLCLHRYHLQTPHDDARTWS